MEPRTMASAEASPACRNPSRPCTAERTESDTSCVRVGSVVRLSNGRIATVLIAGGKPPPENLYRQPDRLRVLRLRRSPGLRRKGGSRNRRGIRDLQFG